jgi:hypothetical protein
VFWAEASEPIKAKKHKKKLLMNIEKAQGWFMLSPLFYVGEAWVLLSLEYHSK